MTDPEQVETQATWLVEGRRPRVLMLGVSDRAEVRQEANRLRAFIEQHGDVIGFDLGFAEDLSSVNADLAIVLGGDGSILRAAKQLAANQIPVVGVNLGKLGFLADLQPNDFVDCFAGICQGEFRLVDHLMLRCQVLRGGKVMHDELGLNETAILAGPPFSMLYIDLYVDSDLATTYSCDGLIISTPVGSTAHNLSAGGPILRKSLQGFVIAPLSPHTLTVRPVVDSADRVYEVVVWKPNETTSVVVDGRTICCLTGEDRVRVERADQTFQLVETQGRNYYRTLREKLGWGGNISRRETERHKPKMTE